MDHWILVEYHGAWGRDAVDASRLTPEVKAHLAERVRALRPAKLLFIRRRERRPGDIHVFWGRSGERAAWLSGTVIDGYKDLIGLDFEDPGEASPRPLFLVCTHGKHDACCARRGVPLFEALRELVDEGGVWQSSHVGGDRFAGNVVCLPEGVYYGRMEPSDVLGLLEAHLAGRIYPERYRGRSCYSFPVQAAERAVRESSGCLDLDGLELVSTSPIRFRAARTVYEIEAIREEGELAHLTCDSEHLSRPRRYVARILRESAA